MIIKETPIVDIDPKWLTSFNYVIYNDVGRIIQTGMTSSGAIDGMISAGNKVVITEQLYNHTDDATHYVVTTNGVPAVIPRPVLQSVPDKTSVLPRGLCTVPALPPCVVKFTGPISGQQSHDTLEDMTIGFVVPGSYIIEAEAFPYLPLKFTLTVGTK